MPICRYFQQGNCRFGDRCCYEHPRNGTPTGYNNQAANKGGGGGGGFQSQYRWTSSSYGQGDYGHQRSQGSRDLFSGGRGGGSTWGDDVSAQEILDGIRYDVEEWETGRMWPFSCYGPNNSKSCLPGLEDLSQDELRLLAYTAEKTKQFDKYRAAYSAAIDAVKHKRAQLRKPSITMKNQLVAVYKGMSDRNPFAASSTTSLSDNRSLSLTDIFGANLANIQVTPGTAASSPSTGSAFGTQPSGTTAAPSAFSTRSVFGNTGAAPQSGTSPFNRAQGTTQSAFGTASGIFGTSSAFGGAAASASGASSSLFGSGSGSGFGSGSQSTVRASTGLFGNGPMAPGPAATQQSKAESKTYTPLASLTAEERQQYVAPIFMMGKVPTRPLPIEMSR